METKDRWWLGSASLSGEEYPYLLRKLEYWGTTFNNASLTTKASQLRLSLPAHPPQPFRYVIDQIFTYHPLTSTIRSKGKVKGLSKPRVCELDPRRLSHFQAFRGTPERDVFNFASKGFRLIIVAFSICFFFFFFSFFSLGSFIRPKKDFSLVTTVRDQIPSGIRPIY